MGGFVPEGRGTNSVEIYHTETATWSRGPDLPVAVNHAMATSLGGLVYLFGGYAGSELSGARERAFVLRPVRAGMWQELPRMPEGRAAGGAAAIGGKIYLAGGVGPDGLAAATLVFDPAANRWTTAPGLPTQREHLGVAGDGRRLYAVGGRTPAGNLAAAEVFDPSGGNWIRLPDMPTARGGIGAAATDNGFIVAAGGEGQTTFDEVEAFDTVAGQWRSLPPMPTARHGLGVVAVGSTVYVIEGGVRPGFSYSDSNEALDLATLRP
jgi:N-acetylneuraminic acid mutarotase